MKKQFFRVKQLADQTFSRASKTEALSDDLQEADRKVEYIRTACQNTSKKIASCLLSQAQDGIKEKRLKKFPEYHLGLAMQECGAADEDCLLRNILGECGKVELDLASEAVQHDQQVEDLVMTRLHQMLEPEVPNILKHKRNLAKLTLDMDSARTRHQTALKHSNTNTGTSTRVESIKEELEDAELKVEQCRDQIASEMFQLLSREAGLAEVIVQFAKLQRAYHESAFRMLEDVIPELEKSINSSCSKPVYGSRLEEHLKVSGRRVAFPIELCVCALLELGMEEEGLFRVAGGASKLRRMKLSFDACCLTLSTALEYRDPHVIAGALKSYLRELPEPLMTYDLYEDWMAAARIQSVDSRLQALWQVVQRLPQTNLDNLHYLVKFLAALSRNQSVNKMTPQNIAIVIAPNLLWSPPNAANPIPNVMNMNSANMYSIIVDCLVTNADWFFPNEMDFYQTLSRESAGLMNGMTTSTGSLSGAVQGQDNPGNSPVERLPGHVRSSSGEGQLISLGEAGDMKRTQSNSSLSDHSSPTQGSPKPATRRKNKPAPVPPCISSTPIFPSLVERPEKPPRPTAPITVSTLPRPSKKISDPELKVVANVNETVAIISAERQTGSDTRRNLNFESSHLPVKTVPEQSPPETRLASSTLERRPKPGPVAAPRSVANINTSPSPVELSKPPPSPGKGKVEPSKEAEGLGLGVEEGVILRNKPAIPERPPTLIRPQSSFRGSRQSSELEIPSADKTNSDSQRPMLERTHMYSVDKQQVSIIQVGGEKTTPVPSNNNNEPPLLQRSPSVGSRPLSVSLTEKGIIMEKPERPPKPEILPTTQQCHTRTRSEGNICDIDTDNSGQPIATSPLSGQSPFSPRMLMSRPPRPPQVPPPPPPPPFRTRSDHCVESTDL